MKTRVIPREDPRIAGRESQRELLYLWLSMPREKRARVRLHGPGGGACRRVAPDHIGLDPGRPDCFAADWKEKSDLLENIGSLSKNRERCPFLKSLRHVSYVFGCLCDEIPKISL
jgi:hypothetical protein